MKSLNCCYLDLINQILREHYEKKKNSRNKKYGEVWSLVFPAPRFLESKCDKRITSSLDADDQDFAKAH